MRVSEHGILIIKKWEGLVDGDPSTPGLDPYYDPINIPTIGWGSTWDVNGDRVTMDHAPITKDTCTILLQNEIRHVEWAIERLIKVPLNENEFNALCSFTYNVGSGNLQASTLRRRLNVEEYYEAAMEFPKWRRAGGRILRGLVNRRAEEQELFLTE